MKKDEFVERVASKSGLSHRDAAKAVDAFLDSITDALNAGDSVSFTGFEKFSTAHRADREGVNPRTPDEKVHNPLAKVPKFSERSSLKNAVRSLRKNAEELDRDYQAFETRIDESRNVFRDIAVS